ncbi:MAG: YbaB/EbfC family nucleoid-associated protein [Anaerolineae bacterium]|uniref:YbaB/EbfC family nucleoid-associated protein n=1 Tax=Promineifilum sp. TaxID=2664178 RepID=UPI001D414041|nr:YbaB/EbfC family nucleoid-associated protein [Anaerolineales bacterium]MCO5180670.1 YbaB/EbfC family nucleoid-associated protein [Promineifilum sp.]MCW5847877.1 YbaB/EbfC family nucleoid-associated protein [Anaerolineae bacterium]
MTKRSFHNKTKKKAASPNDMLGQVQKMQQEMAAAQAALESETVSVTAGGGAITVVITGHQRLQSITINPELLDPEEADFLQDMLVAGVNAAIEQSQALAAQRMEGITGGIGGMDGLLGGLGLG